MTHLYKLVSILFVFALMAGMTTSVYAGGGYIPDTKGADVVKDFSDYTWDYTYDCMRNSGSMTWKRHQVATEGDWIVYHVSYVGQSEGQRIESCVPQYSMNPYKDSWKSSYRTKWNRFTGETQWAKDMWGGENYYSGAFHTYRGKWSVKDGEVKLDQYWIDGVRVR